MKLLPSWKEIGHEGLIVIGGAVLAAFIIGRVPAVRDWINRQWGDTLRPF